MSLPFLLGLEWPEFDGYGTGRTQRTILVELEYPLSLHTLLHSFHDWWELRTAVVSLSHTDEQPLRMELASAEQLCQQARDLALRHRLGTARKRDDLLPRLADNERKLVASYDRITAAVSAKRRISPAGEWIVDNFHVIEEQIRLAKRHLPKGYSQELPHLCSSDGNEGLPRVYDIALKMISFCDGRIDSHNISSFVAAYQELSPLNLGELWAIPIMLRLALIENLRRVAIRVAVGIQDRAIAEQWAAKLLQMAEQNPKGIFLVTADMARSEPRLSNSFIAEFVQRLRGYLPAMSIPLAWIEQQLLDTGLTTEETVQQETKQQAANQVSVGASFGSLRFLAAIDWRHFVEGMSLVEQHLTLDPSGIYAKMDFATRDQYRHVIEALAKGTGADELFIAQTAIALAAVLPRSADQSAMRRQQHVGHFLIGPGYAELCRRLPPLSLGRRLLSTGIDPQWRFGLYVTAIGLLTLGFTAYMTAQLTTSRSPLTAVIAAAILGLIAVSQSVQALVNWLVTVLIKPKLLPEMDFASGIPESARTLVVVPSLLITPDHVANLVEDLEVRFLANRDDHLQFALLTDLVDAPTAVMADDAVLLALAVQGIEDLNRRYAGSGGGFLLLHRERAWNPHDQLWMGYERKRGKLEALGHLLRPQCRPDKEHGFSTIIGDQTKLTSVKYVITLDTDSHLPRDIARQLVGKMAHPLNQPVFDPKQGRITSGYGIMQPRIGEDMAGAQRSWFVRIYGGDPGLDPYSRAVSDVYQDLFAEGSFIGKGIYDVDAYMQVLAGQLPENTVLSHDLLEGSYLRCGFVSDLTLYEQEPHHHGAALRRRHRWIRGDWQILYWITPWLPGKHPNPLTLMSRWKIFDNLRRSYIPLATLLLLVDGWLGLDAGDKIAYFILAILTLPQIFTVLAASLRRIPEIGVVERLTDSALMVRRYSVQAVLLIVFLPVDACVNTHAALTAAWRMLVTKRHLLEWQSQTDPRHSRAKSLGEFYVAGSATVVITTILTALLLWFYPTNLAAAGPFLLLWLLSPGVAWWLSRPLSSAAAPLSALQTRFLERLSRRTWRFFETFVTAEDQWLPPDNYQEYPVAVLAHRTSPTNIGLALLCNLGAYDFGYIDAPCLIGRTQKTFSSLAKMARFRGHFFNWYDTQTLEPLLPQYVSTVDSGNLVGFLLTLKAGLHELGDRAVIQTRLTAGFSDTLRVLHEVLEQAYLEREQRLPTGLGAAVTWRQRLGNCLEGQNPNYRHLVPLAAEAKTLLAHLMRHIDNVGDVESHWWVNALQRQFDQMIASLLSRNLPWLQLEPPTPAACNHLTLAAGSAAPRLLALFATASAIPTWNELVALGNEAQVIDTAAEQATAANEHEAQAWLTSLAACVRSAAAVAKSLLDGAATLASQCDEFSRLEYDFLYDKSRQLLSIGYAVTEHRRDVGCYDLLASEARLGSFIGIAQGLLPQQHWFALGRLLTQVHSGSALLSWSGSMFEYLMPELVMPSFPGSLLERTYHNVVSRQIEYGKQRGVPWGISESGYNTTDMNLNYQYRAFGVPGLGFKRGLVDDLVIAPYATSMALMVDPAAATTNLQLLASKGFIGRYGFYEAIDYTSSRLVQGQGEALLRSYMAHHEGMTFLSLAYHLLDKPMQRRFMADPQVQATELLLQERVPKFTPFYPHAPEVQGGARPQQEQDTPLRVITTAQTPRPEVQLLSNGRYTVMVTQAGGGYSRWQGLALTRWREDPSCDDWGSFCYVRDVGSGATWSAAHQPVGAHASHYEAIFPLARAEFRRLDQGIEMHTEIAVSPEDDIELRRLTFTNLSKEHRTLELTSYAEVVLAPQAADEAHASFSNLFVQTEILSDKQAILATRRPRSEQEQTPTMLHLLSLYDAPFGSVSFETDRACFIGRGQSPAKPTALSPLPGLSQPLSGQDGSVLDPIMAIRCQITLAPESTVKLHFVTGVASNRELAVQMVGKYHDEHVADRVFEMAWTHSQVVLRQFNIKESDAHLYVRLASSLIYANPQLRAKRAVLSKSNRRQADLWGYGISGDLPLVLLRVTNQEHMEIVRQMVQAHAYWRMMGLAIDLLIWNEDDSGYRQVLHEQIMAVISSASSTHLLDKSGGLFVRRTDQMPEDDQILFQTIARVIISDNGGSLAEQMQRRDSKQRELPPLMTPTKLLAPAPLEAPAVPQALGHFANGLGAFSRDGKEYVIATNRHHRTPAPWSNVLANPYFGSVISESGSSYSWCENAHEFRLTPWYNDPVSDRSGEAFYLRDEQNAQVWSPTPLPILTDASYITKHGYGYSSFAVSHQGIASELTIFVAIDAPIKLAILKLRNDGDEARKLTLTSYSEWVLGELRPASLMHVLTEYDSASGALFARNPYHGEFGGRIGFLSTSEPMLSHTCDRSEFIGRNGNAAHPEGLLRTKLSGRVGASMDACAALQVAINLAPGEEREVVVGLGVGREVDDTRTLLSRFMSVPAAYSALREVKTHWAGILGAVQIKTPDLATDLLTNGWLLYQVIASRIWARSGYYQSGGAFGFRDQLQDTMALLHAQPSFLRVQILRCAAHQYRAGDVQHWWHPPSNRGVRTHFSDDYLWLPFATCRYVLSTADTGILDVRTHFLEGRNVMPDEEAYMDLPQISEDTATLYEHCVIAIERALRFGQHGLPLMGCGDWNDGMNLVGAHGKGESVWLAFFLYDILKQFAEVAASHNDANFAQKCLKEAASLQERIEANAWDGEWYLRAYFDDGTPLGTAAASECQIDALPQSWAVLSGAGRPDRAEQAMHMAFDRLVDQDHGIIKLFDPPFDKSLPSPGYIKGYVPGVRENGGQYTHAAVWSTMAFAALGDAEKAWQMLHLINPINHALNQEGLATYRVEPYVMAADVYAVAPHTGRGGWTWYTGSAGWTYRLIVESLLGLTLKANKLTFKPCVPAEWTEYKVRYRYRQTYYQITIHLQASAAQSTRIVVDGMQTQGDCLLLVDDRQEHRAEIYVAPAEDKSLTDVPAHGARLSTFPQLII